MDAGSWLVNARGMTCADETTCSDYLSPLVAGSLLFFASNILNETYLEI